jgi:PAS domain S-box-containing protein
MREDGQAQSGAAEIVLDESGTVLCVHASGYDARLLETVGVGNRAVHHVHPDDQDVFQLLCARALRCGGRAATAEIRWSRTNDRWSKVLMMFQADATGCIRVEFRYDEVRTLRRSEEQLRRVVEGSAQGIIVRTRSDVLFMNESFARLLGYASRRECMADLEHANGGIHPDDLPLVVKHLEARIRGEEAVSNYEFRLLHRDGSPVWVETHAANVSWDGKPASLSWLNDISRRKAIEEELVRSKNAAEFANRTKTQFLANMSHELRTPLNAILGFSEVIQREMFGAVGAKYLEYAGDIHRSGRHLVELVNDVLDLAKLEAGKLELHESDVSVPELVAECLTLVRRRAETGRVCLICELPETLPRLRADARTVKQLLLNFLSNAVKFTPKGGEVRVQAVCDRREGLSLSVSDTGIGMSAAEIQVALSPFGQVDSKLARKHEGTGLGLPICHSLMELHGGALTVTSAPNEGTTLTARFPADRVIWRNWVAQAS